jgi:hypothetical protein
MLGLGTWDWSNPRVVVTVEDEFVSAAIESVTNVSAKSGTKMNSRVSTSSGH